MGNNNGKIISIVAGGTELPTGEVFNELLADSTLILAADGGADNCLIRGISPDLIIGDMDSISRDTLRHFPPEKLIRIDSQDNTDLEKALAFCSDQSPQKIQIFAWSGNRIDHTIGNLLSVRDFYQKYNIPVILHDHLGTINLLGPGEYQLSMKKDTIVSIFCLDPLINLRLTGFRYSVGNPNQKPGFRGISNEINKYPAYISLEQGLVFVYSQTYSVNIVKTRNI
ncbi:MAG: thiamine diphosphokinase [Candidatus Cloacimonetes bacterium]|nr:thiamine diphosphokinase [Candidatus Cloacimonadota bacterium]